MGIAARPSYKVIPQDVSCTMSVLDFLCSAFPAISKDVWVQRIVDGHVFWEDRSLISCDSVCRAQQKVFYYREVATEIHIPFDEEIIYEDEHKLIVCKPHYLPVVPSGPYVDSCLLNRLIKRTSNTELTPAHRIDRDTAGLVLFSKKPSERGLYHGLFASGEIQKTYRAVGVLNRVISAQEMKIGWRVENRIIRSTPRFRQQAVDATGQDINARSLITCLEQSDGLGLFELSPLTGKTHQLRVHMAGLGFPLLNDPYYPVLLPEQSKDDFSKPLQLLAQAMSFTDPVTQQVHRFTSSRPLLWSPDSGQ